MISAIVVAAGKSARMGNINKLSLPFADSTILGTVIHRLLKSKADEIILVHGDESMAYLDYNDPRLKSVKNESPGDGLTSSIQTGVLKAKHDNALLICLGDMPLLTTNDYNAVIENYIVNYIDNYIDHKRKIILQPKNGALIGNPVLFSPHFRIDILSCTNLHGCKSVILDNHRYVEPLECTSTAYFTDIDTMEQYHKLTEQPK